MDIFREVVAWLVATIGLVGWFVFLPQIRLLYKTKQAESFSLLSMWASFAMTITILVHILLQRSIDWKLSITYFTGMALSIAFLSLVHYYRRWPGGRNRQPKNSG